MMPSSIPFLDAPIDAIPEIAWTATSAGHIASFNARWYDYTGLPGSSDSNAHGGDQWSVAMYGDDRQTARNIFDAGINSGSAFAFEVRLRQADGVPRWFRVQVSPNKDPFGEVIGWLGVCTDVDDYKRQGERFEFIAQAGEVLAESLDLQTTLDRLLAIIVPEFGDWAAIDLFDSDDRLKTVAAIHANPEKHRLVKRLLGRYNHDPRIEPKIADVLRKNRPMILREVTSEQVTKSAAPDLLAVIHELTPRSAVTVPLCAHGRTIGSLVAYWAETARRYEDSDLPLFEELTRRAAAAIENARVYEREREIAAEFQRAALPISLPDIPGLRFNGMYVPANDRELLGGDWYDALDLGDGRIVVSVGDVAGSGLPAAVIMSSMRQVIRGVALVKADPIALLDAADRTLKMEHPDTFVTAFVGVIDANAGTMTYASAGHPPPLLRDAGGAITALDKTGLPLGLRIAGETPSSVVLPRSGLLVFYSDGLVEAERDILRGYDRLADAIASPAVAGSPDPADALYRAVLTAGNADDVVVLTLRISLG